ncbi:hypothetical protein CLAFUW4_06389 [Fulvia fulva]|uniref:Uncharacterized protein n=1 Tax=Passalora fulva TaxID=5499 RepID=A0A9Q8LK86_PASFU|nr:uncharacterized protein CLAFUR5_06533 [Fulvia fulva]KAK4624422.1 hypothetical protein CLAFUR4_06392 [Fulvia fulva]KAK4624884.1 hypothetical protein CLAFUR0_06393 [Fulvia fulva]UJO18248.1 hypothetical protein CLAFUR5_06533 [Fulvia fulva]WPV14635.1 hypothetical protein CLAFUW4_06389 [Fulvia fulva]WPV30427.1 hypothetical protein CLAFUW7_06387 [Fulvia fulva]
MKFTSVAALSLSLLVGSVFAVSPAGNCKCQDPYGTEPQNNEATWVCCGNSAAAQLCPNANAPGPNNQCSCGGENKIVEHIFDACCKQNGAPQGAFCWN